MDRANDRTRSMYRCVCVCAELRIASTKGRKKNRKIKRERERKVEDSVEGSKVGGEKIRNREA